MDTNNSKRRVNIMMPEAVFERLRLVAFERGLTHNMAALAIIEEYLDDYLKAK